MNWSEVSFCYRVNLFCIEQVLLQGLRVGLSVFVNSSINASIKNHSYSNVIFLIGRCIMITSEITQMKQLIEEIYNTLSLYTVIYGQPANREVICVTSAWVLCSYLLNNNGWNSNRIITQSPLKCLFSSFRFPSVTSVLRPRWSRRLGAAAISETIISREARCQIEFHKH